MHAGYPAIEFLKDIHVICDKPMTATMEDAHEHESYKIIQFTFFLTHNYSGYPVIREMRSLVKNGELGNLRIVKGALKGKKILVLNKQNGEQTLKEVVQGGDIGWDLLQSLLQKILVVKGNSNKQGQEWRTDPKRSR